MSRTPPEKRNVLPIEHHPFGRYEYHTTYLPERSTLTTTQEVFFMATNGDPAGKAMEERIKDILYLLEHMDMQELNRVLWYAGKL